MKCTKTFLGYKPDYESLQQQVKELREALQCIQKHSEDRWDLLKVNEVLAKYKGE
jgi:hypothetical protein